MHIDGHLLQKTQTDEQSDLSFLECLRDNPASQQGELKKLYDELHGYTTLSDEIKNNERKNFMTKTIM